MDFKIFFCLLLFVIIFSINANRHSKRNDKPAKPTFTEQEKQRAMDKFIDALKTITAGVLSEFTFGSTFYALTVGVYEAITKEKKTLWGQIRVHVKEAIDKSLSEYANNALRNELDEAEVKIRLGDDGIYNEIVALGEKIFPMKWESRPYDDILPIYTIRYVIYLVQAYQIGMERGKVDKCILTELLQTVRKRMISSMKEMIRKKYRKVEASSYGSGGGVKYVNYTIGDPKVESNQFQASILSEGKKEEDVRSLYSKAKFVGSRFQKFYSFQYHIEKIKEETMDYLMLIVSAVNKFFNDEICMGCPGCPTPIEREEFNLDWPTNCYDKDMKCQHPCGDFYKNNSTWCYLKDHYREHEESDDCKPVCIRCCISLEFDSNPDRCKNKYKCQK